MASANCIEPFPAEIDRRDFGNYVSGLADGEGCFQLVWKSNTPIVRFSMSLRADDRDILLLLQRYWGCGKISYFSISPTSKWAGVWKTHTRCDFHVRRSGDLHKRVVPHFTTFPLRAKKRRDFDIWRNGVALAFDVSQRGAMVRGRNSLGQVTGVMQRWTNEEKNSFRKYAEQLREIRKYAPGADLIRAIQLHGEKHPLFAGLE